MKCDLCNKRSRWIYGDLNLCDNCLSVIGIDFEEVDPVIKEMSEENLSNGEEGFLYEDTEE